MHYQITERGDYLRAVIGDAAGVEDFAASYKELQGARHLDALPAPGDWGPRAGLLS